MAAFAARQPDFAEGVRAQLVDKDRRPNWSPARLEAVDVGAVAQAVAGGG
jgi:enoyl-CoA hydratase